MFKSWTLFRKLSSYKNSVTLHAMEVSGLNPLFVADLLFYSPLGLFPLLLNTPPRSYINIDFSYVCLFVFFT